MVTLARVVRGKSQRKPVGVDEMLTVPKVAVATLGASAGPQPAPSRFLDARPESFLGSAREVNPHDGGTGRYQKWRRGCTARGRRLGPPLRPLLVLSRTATIMVRTRTTTTHTRARTSHDPVRAGSTITGARGSTTTTVVSTSTITCPRVVSIRTRASTGITAATSRCCSRARTACRVC